MIKRCCTCFHEKTEFLDAPCFDCGPDHPHWAPKPGAIIEPEAADDEEDMLPLSCAGCQLETCEAPLTPCTTCTRNDYADATHPLYADHYFVKAPKSAGGAWKSKPTEIILDLISMQMQYPHLCTEWIAIDTAISHMYTVKKLIEAKEEAPHDQGNQGQDREEAHV